MGTDSLPEGTLSPTPLALSEYACLSGMNWIKAPRGRGIPGDSPGYIMLGKPSRGVG